MMVQYGEHSFEMAGLPNPDDIMELLHEVFPELIHSGYYHIEGETMIVQCKLGTKLANMQRAFKENVSIRITNENRVVFFKKEMTI